MAEEKTTDSFPAQLKKAFDIGTEAHTSAKGFSANAKWWALSAGGFILLVGFVFMFLPHLLEEKIPSFRVQPGKATEAVITKNPSWTQSSQDGSLPVGEWSVPMEMAPGCGVKFAGGCGVVYEVQYRFYNPNGKWNDQMCGTSPNMNEFRFKILRGGEKELPYTMKCS